MKINKICFKLNTHKRSQNMKMFYKDISDIIIISRIKCCYKVYFNIYISY